MNVLYVLVFISLLPSRVEPWTIFSWVVLPVWLMFDAYMHIATSLRAVQSGKPHKVE